MKPRYDASARKRPVNLTLNENLVDQARSVTTNLSAVVEALLAEFVARERERRAAHVRACEAAAAMWNEFADEHVSVADEYSPL